MTTLLVEIEDRVIEVEAPDRVTDDSASISIDGREYCCQWIKTRRDGTVNYSLLIDNRPVFASVNAKDDGYRVSVNDREIDLTLVDKKLWELKKMTRVSETVATKEKIKAPMSGQIVRIYAGVGDILPPSAPVIALEAMKMEMDIWTRTGGRLAEIKVKVGDKVDGDKVLAIMDTNPEEE